MAQPSRARRGPELLGILLILIGAVFLLRTLGILDIGWGSLWPLIIVAVGVFVVVGAVWRPTAEARSVTLPADGAERLELRLRLGAGRFRLTGQSDAAALVTVESTDDDVDSSVRRDGSLARVTLNRDPSWWFGGWSRGGGDWRIGVSDAVATRLEMNAGAGDFVLDLLPLRIVEASVSIGAAQLRMRLPRPLGDVPVRVSAGAAGVTLEVPPGVEARVTTTGLLSVTGRNETPGYAAATDRVSVRVEGGASSVTIV